MLVTTGQFVPCIIIQQQYFKKYKNIIFQLHLRAILINTSIFLQTMPIISSKHHSFR